MSDVAAALGSHVDHTNPWANGIATIDDVVRAADDMAIKSLIYELAKPQRRSIVKEGDEARRAALVFGFALQSYVDDKVNDAAHAAAEDLRVAFDDLEARMRDIETNVQDIETRSHDHDA